MKLNVPSVYNKIGISCSFPTCIVKTYQDILFNPDTVLSVEVCITEETLVFYFSTEDFHSFDVCIGICHTLIVYTNGVYMVYYY